MTVFWAATNDTVPGRMTIRFLVFSNFLIQRRPHSGGSILDKLGGHLRTHQRRNIEESQGPAKGVGCEDGKRGRWSDWSDGPVSVPGLTRAYRPAASRHPDHPSTAELGVAAALALRLLLVVDLRVLASMGHRLL